MNRVKKTFSSRGHANAYDKMAEKSKWLDPAVVFGMAWRFVRPGDSLLDVGIGTGLSSELFYSAGLEIHGIDFSPEMLACCREKQMAATLREHDLTATPYPLPDHSIDHAVCTGVTHLFEDVTPIFRELYRILRPGGIFAFVVADCEQGAPRTAPVANRHAPGEKITLFSYSREQIMETVELQGFIPVYDLKFEASAIGRRTAWYRAWVVQRAGQKPEPA